MTSRRTLLTQSAALTAATCLAPAGCGFLLYPERAGQDVRGLRLDAGVVLLDGLLCLLFVIPGVVAFIVDVSSGCIYMPPPEPGQLSLRRVRLPGRRPADLEAAIAAASGLPAGRHDPRLRVVPDATHADLTQQLHLVPPDIGCPAAAVAWELDAQGLVCALHVPA